MAQATNRTSAPPLIGATKKRKKRKPSVAKTMTHRPKRRKIKGVGEELPKVMEMILAASGGAFVGRIISNMKALEGTPTATNATPTDYSPYVCLAGGVGMMLFVKNPLAKSAGLGLALNGTMSLIPDKDIPQIGAVRMIGASKHQAPPQIIRIGNNNRRPSLIAGNTTPAMVGGNYGKNKRMMGGMGG